MYIHIYIYIHTYTSTYTYAQIYMSLQQEVKTRTRMEAGLERDSQEGETSWPEGASRRGIVLIGIFMANNRLITIRLNKDI